MQGETLYEYTRFPRTDMVMTTNPILAMTTDRTHLDSGKAWNNGTDGSGVVSADSKCSEESFHSGGWYTDAASLLSEPDPEESRDCCGTDE
jgi:hypothetical protein